jgi:hypothetical protein
MHREWKLPSALGIGQYVGNATADMALGHGIVLSADDKGSSRVPTPGNPVSATSFEDRQRKTSTECIYR